MNCDFFQVVAVLILCMGSPNVNEVYREKGRWEPHKNAKCCFEQILETTLHQTAVGPIVSHLTNYPSKMNKTWATTGEIMTNP